MPESDRPDREWFRKQPEAEQKRLTALNDQFCRLAFSYTLGILLAPADAPMDSTAPVMCNGSGCLLKIDGRYFVCTAWHVVDHWLSRRQAGDPALFQVGDVGMDAVERLAHKDEGADVAFLRVRPEEVPRIGVQVFEPPQWPPPRLAKGQYVVIAGYPGSVRERESRRDVVFKSFSARLEVAEVRDRFAICTLDRDYWEEVRTAEDPPSDIDLGGMSGGPALLVGTLYHPIVGIVSEVSEMDGFALIKLGTLAHIENMPPPS
jgi:hypothetical protein